MATPQRKAHRTEEPTSEEAPAAAATGFAAVPETFASDVEAQAVMRGTHDGFRHALLTSSSAQQLDDVAEKESAHLGVWQSTKAAQADTLRKYATAQHSLASRLWQTREVDYVIDTIAAALGIGPKRPELAGEGARRTAATSATSAALGGDEGDAPRVRPCGAAAPLVRGAIDAYQRAHDGAQMPREAYSEAAAKFNAVFTPAGGGAAKVLDVGSCYNPFGRSDKAKGWLDVTAVDLEPSERAPDVQRCDWLEVGTHDAAEPGDEGALRFFADVEGGRRAVQSIQRGAFDVVVMSYLLSFLPSAQLRLRAIRRAFACLRPGGVLVIVEARRGGHRVGGWPARWTAAVEDASVSGCDALRVRQDVMKKSVGLVFAAGLAGLGHTNLRKVSSSSAGPDDHPIVPCMTFDHEIEDAA